MTFTTTVTFPATQHITYTTTAIPFEEVRTRLEAQIHKASSVATNWLPKFFQATTTAEITAIIDAATEGGDMLYFQEFAFSDFLRIVRDDPTIPDTIYYMIGNPLHAATFVPFNLEAALFIPPRIVLRRLPEQNATSLSYFLPSSLLPVDEQSPAYASAISVFDGEMKKLVLDVLD